MRNSGIWKRATVFFALVLAAALAFFAAPGNAAERTTASGSALVHRAATQADPEYDPAWAKPWLSEGFRAPSDPLQREALWGPVVEQWVDDAGGECKRFEYGTELCDSADGAVYAAILEDWAEREQYPDGTKKWISDPKNVPVPQAERDIRTATRPREDDECAKIGYWGPAHAGGADPDRQWRAFAYQFQITHVSPVWGFYVHNTPDRVEFDGCQNGKLLEVKAHYAELWAKSRIGPVIKENNKKTFVTQGRNQQGAASRVGSPALQWHFAEKEAATTVKDTSINPPTGWFPEAEPPVGHPDVYHTAPLWQ